MLVIYFENQLPIFYVIELIKICIICVNIKTGVSIWEEVFQ